MYTVYKRTTPDGKVYIGCTSRTLEERAGPRGQNYSNSHRFWAAIVRFGWHNITSEILKVYEDIEDAMIAEVTYIEACEATNPEFGYNTNLASGFSATPEVRRRIAECVTAAMSTDVRKRMSANIKSSQEFRTAVTSDEHKARCSVSAKRRFSKQEERDKMSEAVKNSAAFQAVMNDKEIQERRIASLRTPESRQKRSAAIKGRIHVWREDERKMIYPEQFAEYRSAGWKKGRPCIKKGGD